ncbi:MAG: MBL fold metallo-hydrolase [Bacteroidales bacterium]|nr:MBL fold metallo-hydrolase [Bacteroidales bacterium]MCF8404161.1 MBL fold metallo-hydrolase [Bacteroidales bacterium]
MRIYPIVSENWKMDGGVAFGVVPKTIWQKLVEPDENNMIKITTRCLLVVEGDRKILFDTGMGRKQAEKYYSFRYIFGEAGLEKSLQNYGYTKNDITDVVFTHLHDDHCGDAIRINASGKPELTFKNATYYCSASQWEWANNPNKREAGSFFKINFQHLMDSGKLRLIEKEGLFCPNIKLRIMDGHTRGQLIPVITDREKTFVFIADFIPLLANIPIPYIASVDIQPLDAIKGKVSFLEEALEKNYYLIFEHDYYHEVCNLKKTEKGIQPDKIFRLSEI